MIVSPVTPHGELSSVMAKGIGEGTGDYLQPTNKRRTSIPIYKTKQFFHYNLFTILPVQRGYNKEW